MSIKFTIPAAQVVEPTDAPPGCEPSKLRGTLGTTAHIWTDPFPKCPPGHHEVVTGPTPTGGYVVEYRPIAPATRQSREEQIAAFLIAHKDDPDGISVRTIEKATGIPKSTVCRSPAWKAFAAWRDTGKVGEIRIRQLTDAILLNLPDRSAINDGADTLEALIASQKTDSAEDFYPPQYDDPDDRG